MPLTQLQKGFLTLGENMKSFYAFPLLISLPTQLFEVGWMGLRDNPLYFTKKKKKAFNAVMLAGT